jgi:glycosyltransferase involved in cell wall biosynthesis
MSRAPSPADLSAVRAVRPLLAAAVVAHLHSSKAGAIGRLAAWTLRSARPRVLFTPHGWSWYVGGRLAPAYRHFERWAARVTDVVTVVSAGELQDGRDVLGARARIEVVRNGVDLDAFTPHGPTAPRQAAPLVVQVGRLSRQKGQDRSVRALAACQNRSVRLRFVGDGPDAALITALAAQLGVADRVEFVGSVDPRPHLRAADVVALPSRWEGMSLVLLEAMAVGKPIVAADCSGSDALAHAGVLIEHRSDERAVPELGAAVHRLLADVGARAELGRTARIRAEQRFSLTGTIAQYRSLWLEPGG